LKNGATALILASIKNRSATVELLLEAGADMDAMNNVSVQSC
jgi:ankyrin repeat protein